MHWTKGIPCSQFIRVWMSKLWSKCKGMALTRHQNRKIAEHLPLAVFPLLGSCQPSNNCLQLCLCILLMFWIERARRANPQPLLLILWAHSHRLKTCMYIYIYMVKHINGRLKTHEIPPSKELWSIYNCFDSIILYL